MFTVNIYIALPVYCQDPFKEFFALPARASLPIHLTLLAVAPVFPIGPEASRSARGLSPTRRLFRRTMPNSR